jgi:hypothetical protein
VSAKNYRHVSAVANGCRVQQLLRMSYAHVQMMMYRPFIHYVSQACQQGNTSIKGDKRSFACAAACVSVARNIVHITSEMKRRGLLVGAYWFVMYTTFFAIVSLVYFVLENPNSPTGKDILKDAMEGRDTLASLAKRSLAADRCSISLAVSQTNTRYANVDLIWLQSLFDELPEKLKERRGVIQPSPSGKKRSAATIESATLNSNNRSTPNIAIPGRDKGQSSVRARTLPQDFLAKIAKRNSMPNEVPTQPSFPMPADIAGSPTNSQLMSLNSPAIASPLSQQFEFTPQMAHSQIPDLKNVMFPGDNPFAYPNQPISTLESSNPQYYGESNSNEASVMGTPASHMSGQSNEAQRQYEMANLQRMYEGSPHLSPYGGPGRSYGAGSYGGSMPNYGGPIQRYGANIQGQGAPEDYWNSVSKGNMASRTGFTPGGGVNLEELFGGDTWGNIWEQQGMPR